jgi:hypothetical protein
MRSILATATIFLLGFGIAHAQWTLQESHTSDDLRGIDNVGGGVVWASGTNGAVLRSEDSGYLWQRCAIPPGAEKLDFRGIQAFDAKSAIVMSSGKGDLSRLYKTIDGCQSWKLVFTNPDPDGFWDAVMYVSDFDNTFILGDPVGGHFRLFSQTGRDGKFSDDWNGHEITATSGEAAFAASNSLFVYSLGYGMFSLITGGSRSEIIHEEYRWDEKRGPDSNWSRVSLPFATGPTSGAFSIAAKPRVKSDGDARFAVAVGGDYLKPDDSAQTAAYTSNSGDAWESAQTPPHGYRSAVAYDSATKTWITVGPNGTDISTDDGRNWRAVHPNAARHEPADADRNWNALSLPFVVGPHGRIGKLDPDAITNANKGK